MEFKLLRCKVCGKIIAVVKDTPVPTMCCGQPMEVMNANTGDGAFEKHVPVMEVNGREVLVKVGSVPHPMLPEHFIEFIVLRTNKGNQRKALKPGEAPEARFQLLEGEEVLEVLEYCNLHGLYKAA